jgi:hypothetical protein
MASLIAGIADGVVALLTAGNTAGAFTPAITPARSYECKLLLEDSGVLHVDVVPSTPPVLVVAARVDMTYTVYVDIAVRKVFTSTDDDANTGKPSNAAVDALVSLVEQINEYIAKKTKRGIASPLAVWVGSEIPAPWDVDHLVNHRQFTGILRAHYRADRPIA